MSTNVMKVGCLLSGISALALADTRPVEQHFSYAQARSQYDRAFVRHTIPSKGLSAYLMVSDVETSFDTRSFRTDAVIMPTNQSLLLGSDKYPGTQRVLMERVESVPEVLKYVNDQVKKRRRNLVASDETTPVIPLGSGTFLVRLKTVGLATKVADAPFPRAACFVATDYPDGSAARRRDLPTQFQIRLGVRECLRQLDDLGFKSLVLPLIGAASYATEDSSLADPKERNLLRCRLLNSVSAIGLGIADFSPAAKSLTEIGVIEWSENMNRLFDAPTGKSDPTLKTLLAQEGVDYANRLRSVFLQAVKGDPAGTHAVFEQDCNAILKFN